MSEPEFSKFLLNTLRKSLYLAGKRLYESDIEFKMSDISSSKESKQAFFVELSKLAAELAEKAVKDLGKEGIKNSDDMLKQQEKVKQIMRRYQEFLQTKLLEH